MAITAIEAIKSAEQKSDDMILEARAAAAKAIEDANALSEEMLSRSTASAGEEVEKYCVQLKQEEENEKKRMLDENQGEIGILKSNAAKNMNRAVDEILSALMKN